MAINLKKILFGGFSSGGAPRLESSLPLRVPGFSAPGLNVGINTLVDGAAVAIDASLADTHVLTCTTNGARVFGVPTNGVAGQTIIVRIINTSGGNLTVTTFNASIRQPSLTLPATATQRDYTLRFDGSTWCIADFAGANVPN